jgi:hypothetical protein
MNVRAMTALLIIVCAMLRSHQPTSPTFTASSTLCRLPAYSTCLSAARSRSDRRHSGVPEPLPARQLGVGDHKQLACRSPDEAETGPVRGIGRRVGRKLRGAGGSFRLRAGQFGVSSAGLAVKLGLRRRGEFASPGRPSRRRRRTPPRRARPGGVRLGRARSRRPPLLRSRAGQLTVSESSLVLSSARCLQRPGDRVPTSRRATGLSPEATAALDPSSDAVAVTYGRSWPRACPPRLRGTVWQALPQPETPAPR